jgi:hypothetical protein
MSRTLWIPVIAFSSVYSEVPSGLLTNHNLPLTQGQSAYPLHYKRALAYSQVPTRQLALFIDYMNFIDLVTLRPTLWQHPDARFSAISRFSYFRNLMQSGNLGSYF